MKKPVLLLAGGGYADIPLIKSAKALGYYVITSGYYPNDLGHIYSDEYVMEDFSDINAMLMLAKSKKIDAVCACCNDFSALTAAYIAEQMDLPGHDTYETATIIHHKDRYRRFALDNNIPTPLAMGFNNIEEAQMAAGLFEFPVIIKPVDLTGGKGISKAENTKGLNQALIASFQRSKIKRVVIEEFVEGSRHGISTFLNNGKIVFYFTDNEHYFQNPYMVSSASAPGKVPHKAIEKICRNSEKIASLLNLKDGIFHIQFIIKDDEPYIIEICRRAPGDLYVTFVSHATGINYADYIVRAACGIDCSDLEHKAIRGFFSRCCIMAYENGRVSDIVFDDYVKSQIFDEMMWWYPGMEINDYLTQKCGIVFLEFDSDEEMQDKTGRINDLIKVNIY